MYEKHKDVHSTTCRSFLRSSLPSVLLLFLLFLLFVSVSSSSLFSLAVRPPTLTQHALCPRLPLVSIHTGAVYCMQQSSSCDS